MDDFGSLAPEEPQPDDLEQVRQFVRSRYMKPKPVAQPVPQRQWMGPWSEVPTIKAAIEGFQAPGRALAGDYNPPPITPGVLTEEDVFRQDQARKQLQEDAAKTGMFAMLGGPPMAQAGSLGMAGGRLKQPAKAAAPASDEMQAAIHATERTHPDEAQWIADQAREAIEASGGPEAALADHEFPAEHDARIRAAINATKTPDRSGAVTDRAQAEAHPETIDTRLVIGKNEIPVPGHEAQKIVDMDALRATPETYERNVNVLRNQEAYPHVPADLAKNGTTDELANHFIGHVKDNLLWLFDQIPQNIRDRSAKWYEGGNKIVKDWAQEYGVPEQSVAGAIASLSPQRDWFKNVSATKRVLDTMFGKNLPGGGVATPEMESTFNRIVKTQSSRKGEKEASFEKYRPLLDRIRGRSLADIDAMPLPADQKIGLKALWIRLHDETYNPRTYPLVHPEGTFGENAPMTPGGIWGSNEEISRAIEAIESGGKKEILSPLMGTYHKVRNFFNNLLDPFSPHRDVTIDTHAVAAGLLRPLGGTAVPVAENFGKSPGVGKSANTGIRGTYPLYAEAYRQAAAERGVLPRELQSITWEAARGLFKQNIKGRKGKGAQDAIDSLWRAHAEGKISADDVRNQILGIAGGIEKPFWHTGGHDIGAPALAQAPANAGELSRSGVHGTPAAGIERGGGGQPAAGASEGFSGATAEPSSRGSRLGPFGGGPRGGGGGLEEAQRAAARAAGAREPLQGLPDKPLTLGGEPFIPGPIAKAHQAAAEYMRETGRAYEPPVTHASVDVPRAQRIAKAFEEMPHAPNDPKVRAAYDAMIDETLAQYQAIKKTGLKIDFIKPGQPDPYRESPRLAAKDFRDNNHLWVFPTETGFGSGSAESAAAIKDNPLMRPTEEKIGDHRLLANDVFRIVHDFFGHFKDGVGFRAAGEENAWRSHAAMYSPLARRAMTSETRGQNSWLNYGPHGDKNRTAKSEDTVYAPQKIGILPDWVMEEGRRDPPALRRGSFASAPADTATATRSYHATAPMRAAPGNFGSLSPEMP